MIGHLYCIYHLVLILVLIQLLLTKNSTFDKIIISITSFISFAGKYCCIFFVLFLKFMFLSRQLYQTKLHKNNPYLRQDLQPLEVLLHPKYLPLLLLINFIIFCVFTVKWNFRSYSNYIWTSSQRGW